MSDRLGNMLVLKNSKDDSTKRLAECVVEGGEQVAGIDVRPRLTHKAKPEDELFVRKVRGSVAPS